MECIVYLELGGKKKLVASPSFDSLEKFLGQSRERAKYKDGPVLDFVK